MIDSPERLVDHLIDAWNKHAMEAFGRLFAEDGQFVNMYGMWWRGRAEIEANHARAHAGIFRNSRLAGTPASVQWIGEAVAIVHVAWTLVGHVSVAGEPLPPRRGILLLVMVRDGEGWAIKAAQNTHTMAP